MRTEVNLRELSSQEVTVETMFSRFVGVEGRHRGEEGWKWTAIVLCQEERGAFSAQEDKSSSKR